jgi:hypothetical protein
MSTVNPNIFDKSASLRLLRILGLFCDSLINLIKFYKLNYKNLDKKIIFEIASCYLTDKFSDILDFIIGAF